MTAASLFPLIRHISHRVSRFLIRLPISANLVTTASLLAGITACWYLTDGTYRASLIGAAFFMVCYILDNSDGEVARAKNQCSPFGEKYDTFVDWVVHSGFFACLGWGVAMETGQHIWLWMGLVAAAGGSINYFVGIYLDHSQSAVVDDVAEPAAAIKEAVPTGLGQWAIYFFRELSRADFCFIVLLLALLNSVWLLLPAGAIGAQIYWLTQFVSGARKYHV